MSTIGSGSGHSPTLPCWVRPILPSLIRQISALVPPMSTVMMSLDAAGGSRRPWRRRRRRPGPDSAVSAGARRIAAAPATPPFDCISSSSGAATFSSARRCSMPADIGGHARHDAGVEPRSSASARIRAPPAERRSRWSRRRRAASSRRISAARRSCTGLAKACSRQTPTASTPIAAHALPRPGGRWLRRAASTHGAAGKRCARRPRRCARPAPAAAAWSRCRGWPCAECPGGRCRAHGGSRASSPGRCARPCPRGSCWSRPWCRAARGRARVARRRASASARRMPFRKASEGIGGHARRLGAPDVAARRGRCRAMSVKVPPMSTAMARRCQARTSTYSWRWKGRVGGRSARSARRRGARRPRCLTRTTP